MTGNMCQPESNQLTFKEPANEDNSAFGEQASPSEGRKKS